MLKCILLELLDLWRLYLLAAVPGVSGVPAAAAAPKRTDLCDRKALTEAPMLAIPPAKSSNLVPPPKASAWHFQGAGGALRWHVVKMSVRSEAAR